MHARSAQRQKYEKYGARVSARSSVAINQMLYAAPCASRAYGATGSASGNAKDDGSGTGALAAKHTRQIQRARRPLRARASTHTILSASLRIRAAARYAGQRR